MFDEPRRFARRTGFAVVIVGSQGNLVGFGHGRPPHWITSAAGAEAWAFSFVVSSNPAVPRTITDCMEVCNALRGGRGAATAGNKRLARVWGRTFNALEDFTQEDAQQLIWMPAHGSAGTVGVARKSDESRVTLIDWRANRLVDALAKSAAGFDRAQPQNPRGSQACR
jgi:hypothetical protein